METKSKVQTIRERVANNKYSPRYGNPCAKCGERQAGRKEVVDFIRSHFNDVITVEEMQGLDCWNEKLKEWGL
jgi:hypothetical protein